jgi:hypothetical protein
VHQAFLAGDLVGTKTGQIGVSDKNIDEGEGGPP